MSLIVSGIGFRDEENQLPKYSRLSNQEALHWRQTYEAKLRETNPERAEAFLAFEAQLQAAFYASPNPHQPQAQARYRDLEPDLTHLLEVLENPAYAQFTQDPQVQAYLLDSLEKLETKKLDPPVNGGSFCQDLDTEGNARRRQQLGALFQNLKQEWMESAVALERERDSPPFSS